MDTLRQGLRRIPAPGLPGGWQIKCGRCNCSVNDAHVPGGAECAALVEERIWKRRFDW